MTGTQQVVALLFVVVVSALFIADAIKSWRGDD